MHCAYLQLTSTFPRDSQLSPQLGQRLLFFGVGHRSPFDDESFASIQRSQRRLDNVMYALLLL
jgi:hypothetical protein